MARSFGIRHKNADTVGEATKLVYRLWNDQLSNRWRKDCWWFEWKTLATAGDAPRILSVLARSRALELTVIDERGTHRATTALPGVRSFAHTEKVLGELRSVLGANVVPRTETFSPSSATSITSLPPKEATMATSLDVQAQAASVEGGLWLGTDDVLPFPGQPRTDFDEDRIRELAHSIVTVGQQQAITVRRREPGAVPPFKLVAGERRLRACRLVGKKVLAVVIGGPVSDRQHFRESFVENQHRESLSVLDEARAMKRLQDEGETLEEIALLAKYETPFPVTVRIRILDLQPEVLELLDSSRSRGNCLNLSVAYELVKYTEKRHKLQVKLAHDIVREGLGVKQAQQRILLAVEADGGPGLETRQRRPDKAREIVQNFLRRLRNDLIPLLNFPRNLYGEMFAGAHAGSLDTAISTIDGALEELAILRSTLVEVRSASAGPDSSQKVSRAESSVGSRLSDAERQRLYMGWHSFLGVLKSKVGDWIEVPQRDFAAAIRPNKRHIPGMLRLLRDNREHLGQLAEILTKIQSESERP